MPSKDFLALNPAFNAADMPGANRRRSKRSAPGLAHPERAKPGGGDRQKDLEQLARAGWNYFTYDHASGLYWLWGKHGTGPRCASYRAMLDTGLEML